MSERDKFMLDMNGYLVIPGFLTEQEVSSLNASFDANWERRVKGAENAAGKRRGFDQFHGMLSWPLPHSQPFRDLLAHPKLVPYLNTIFGTGWRMDHSPFMLTAEAGYDGEPGGGMAVHGGGTRGEHGGEALGAAYYRYANGVMRSGMLVCSFQLSDMMTGDGGFGVVPASHKANFPMPREIASSPTRDIGTARRGQRGDGIHPPVVNPTCPIGSLLIFLEATYHTTLPWTNQDHARRSLLYRYSPRYMHYASELYATTQPAWVAELSEEQQAVLEPPGIRRPELDGATGRLANSLDATRVSYPPGGAPPSGAVGAVAPAARNPTDSRSYQATRGGNEDG